MPVITLPDGSQRRFDRAISVADVAASIGPGLAKAALAGRVDGVLVDTSALIDHDASLSIVTDKDPDGLDIIRHSTAHLLANAVQELYPDAQVTMFELSPREIYVSVHTTIDEATILIGDGDAVTIGEVQFRYLARPITHPAEPKPAEPVA